MVNTCNSLSFTSSGGLVASGHVNGSLLFWDRRATSGQAAHEMPALHSGCITSVAAAANQGVLLCLFFVWRFLWEGLFSQYIP